MKRFAITALAAVCLSGCASIFNGSTQPVSFKSEPAGASVSVVNRAGQNVGSGSTPVTLELRRGAGYFKPEVYKVRFEKPGFAAQELTITGSMSGWYIGNIVFGGLIGMLAVDPVTGAMYKFEPEELSTTLQPEPAKTAQAGASLTFVSTLDLTPEQLKRAQPLLAAAR